MEAPPRIQLSSVLPRDQTHRKHKHTHHRTKAGRKNPKKSTRRKGTKKKRVGRKASELGIGDGGGIEGKEGRRGGAPPRRPEEEACLTLRQGRSPVPRWPHRALPQARALCQARRHRRASLPRRRPRVPRRRGPRAGGERCAGQQEEPDHPAARAARDPQRRGAREAAGRRHHRLRRGAAQHQPRPASQEDRGRGCQGSQAGQGGHSQVSQEGHSQVAQEGGRLLGPGSAMPVPRLPPSLFPVHLSRRRRHQSSLRAIVVMEQLLLV